MSDDILFPDKEQLEDLSVEVGGLVFATYTFPSPDLIFSKKMAVQIASGQTLGFVPEDLVRYVNYVGRVQQVQQINGEGQATIAFPAILFGADIAGLLTVLFGKISFAPGLRLISIDADQRYLNTLKGPKCGSSGLRALAKKASSKLPLLMAILKPGIGPSNDHIAAQFSQLISAGTDLVKDDETRIDLCLDDASRRLESILESGQGRGIYVMHLTGKIFELKQNAIHLQKNGAQAFLFCPFTYGISVFQALCNDPEIKVPILAHPAFTGIMYSGLNAISAEVVLGSLLRWAGADGVLFPSPYGGIALPLNDAQAVHRELIKKLVPLKATASIPSAGIVPDFVKSIKADFGAEVVVNAGTGMARTGGSLEEGARAFLREINTHFND